MGKYDRPVWGGGPEPFGTGDSGFGTTRHSGGGTAYGGGFGLNVETGRHAGRGPKSYRRDDRRIYEEVCERLCDHPDLDASEIEVQVSEGEVTLTGTVDGRHSKWMAEDTAASVTGARDVGNGLRVQEGAEVR